MARITVEDCVDKVANRFDLVLLATIEADYRNNQVIEGQCASLGGHPMGRALTGTDAVHATSHTSSRHQMRRCHAEQREGRSTAVSEPCSFLLVIVVLWPAAAG